MLRCQFFQRNSGYKSESEYLSDTWTGEFNLNTDTCGRGNFESRKKDADSKISDTCGRGLNLFNSSLVSHLHLPIRVS